jgi:two-component system OmpR family response regulator
LKTPPLKRLVYVDDDADIREIVSMALTLDGDLDVHLSDGGEPALELMRELGPDLVVLDVMMPGMDGPTLFGRMRADPRLAGIPVIFMSAKANAPESSGIHASALGVIAKPFDPMVLRQQVQTLWEAAHD